MDNYEKIALLKTSENAEVWQVQEKNTGRKAVLKSYGALFPCEIINRLQKIRQSNLAAILAAGVTATGYFIVEEFVEGVSLQDMIDGGKIFKELETISVGIQLCDALAALHQNGIVYRDLKPSNVMFQENGIVKLIDFQTARLYDGSRNKDTYCWGTEGYAPPEQYGFCQTDIRSDIYALGVTLYELQTGKMPVGKSVYAGKLKYIFKRCLDFNPNRRFDSAERLKKALDRAWHGTATWVLTAAVVLMFLVVLWTLSHSGTPVTESPSDPTVPPSTTDEVSAAITQSDPSAEATPAPKEPTPSPPSAAPKAEQQQAAEMSLHYVVNQSDMENRGEFYTNAEGLLEFAMDEPLDDWGIRDLSPDAVYITYTIPQSRVRFRVENKGDLALQNPIVRLQFSDVLLIQRPDDSIVFSDHVHGVGMYTRAQWNATSIAPGMDSEFTLDMAGCPVLSSQASVTITIAADNFKAQTFTIPVKTLQLS